MLITLIQRFVGLVVKIRVVVVVCRSLVITILHGQILPSEESNEMTLIGNWSYPTQIKFGAGRIRKFLMLVIKQILKTTSDY